MHQVHSRSYPTSAKAERELGYAARPYAEALADALDWFRGRRDDPVIWLGAAGAGDLAGAVPTGFWLCSEREDGLHLPEPAWPDVVAVVPARNEADVIARSLGSVAAQDYPGNFRVILVDDNSEDGTGEIARTERPSA